MKKVQPNNLHNSVKELVDQGLAMCSADLDKLLY